MSGHIDLGSITPTKYFLAIAVVLGLLFGLTGNEDGQSSFPLYLLRWQLQSVGAIAFLVFSHTWVCRLMPLVSRNPWASLLMSGLIGLLLFSPFNFLIDVLLDNEYLESENWVAGWLEELGYLMPPGLLAWLAINSPWVLGYRIANRASVDRKPELNNSAAAKVSEESESEEKENEKEKQTKAAELPNSLAAAIEKSEVGELIYLKAELHYLAVVTSKTKSLLLYNLRDAIHELSVSERFNGFQCHRSYWVNLEQVIRFKKVGRQGVLLMTNGDEVPVSRKQLAKTAAKFPS